MTGEILPSYTSVSSVSAQDGEYEESVQYNEKSIVLGTGKASDGTDSTTGKKKRYTRTIMFSCVGIIVVIGIVSAAVYFGMKFGLNRNRNSLSINNIITASVFDKSSLLNESSPQYRAQQWMLLNDTYGSTLLASPYGQRSNPEYITKKIIQRFALAVVYYSMNLSNTTTNWMNTMSNECVRDINGTSTWDGLNCNSDDELVTLWLDNRNIAGTIPLEIGLLDKLEYLSITNNTMITGSIPTTLDMLTSLKYLSLAGNGLSGNIQVSSITNLRYLNVAKNRLSGIIPDTIRQLKELQTLVLSGNAIGSTIPFNALASLPLKHLALSSNSFTGTISSDLGMLQRLQYMNIENNSLEGRIPDVIGHLTNLKSINLKSNSLTGQIPEVFTTLNELEFFAVESNMLSGSISTNIAFLPSIKMLNFGNNSLKGTIPDISTLTSLQALNLKGNDFEGNITAMFSKLNSIEYVNLDDNQFTGFVPNFNGNKIRFISMQNNNIHDNKTKLELFCGKSTLEVLLLNNNNLTGAVPHCLKASSRLMHVSL